VSTYKVVRSDDSPFNTYDIISTVTGEVLGHVTGWSKRQWSAKDAQGNALRPPSVVGRPRYFSLRKHAVNGVLQSTTNN
jgi:hypothetical protein